MTDHGSTPDEPDDIGDDAFTPGIDNDEPIEHAGVEAPAEPTVPLPGDAIAEGSPPVRRKRVGLIVGAIALVGAVVFAGTMLMAKTAGPEDVAQDLFVALGEEDALGAAASVLPSERRFLVEPLFEAIDEAERLGFLAAVDVENVQGFDLQFTDVTYEVEMLADDLAWVAIKGDTGARVIPDDFPLGPVLTRYLPDDWAADIETEMQTGSFASDFGLALVETDGKWYVGLTYTIAEAARRSAGEPFPQQQPFSEPQGAETAAQALEKAVLAFVNIDLRGLVDVLAPGETAAFRRYAGLFMDDWDAAIADFRNAMDEASFSYSVDEVLTGSEQRGDDTVAWIEDIPRFSASIDAPDVGRFSVERDGDCLTIEIPQEMIEALGPAFAGEIDFSEFDGRSCIESNPFGDLLPEDQADPLAGQEEFLYDMPAFGPLLERWLTIGDDASESGTADVHFEVIEVDGRWYVSPIGTMWRWLFVFTGTLDQDLIIEVGDDLQQSVDDPEAFARRFEEWAMEIDDGGLLNSLGLFAPFSEQTAGPMTMFGPEMLAPFAGAPNVLLVWDYDVDTVTNRIEELYGQGAVLGVIDPPDMHRLFSNLGPGATGGLTPDEFPHGIHLAALDVDTLVEIFNWFEVLDLFSAADLGLGNA